MKRLFPTQEIGSLKRAPFLKKTIGEKEVKEAEYWGELLGVENYESFCGMLRRKEYTNRDLFDWASLYSIRFFERAGLDVIWDGEQRRSEMYEYAMDQIEGVRFLGRVKVWDLETYNKAAIVGEIGLKDMRQVEEFLFVKRRAKKEVKIPITGQYTLMDWSFDEYYAPRLKHVEDHIERRRRARMDMLFDLSRKVIGPIVRALSEAGAKRIQIDEPALTTKKEEVEAFVQSFNEMRKGMDVTFTVHVCYSDYSRLFPYILDLKAEQISIECANRDSAALGTTDEVRRGYQVLKVFREYGFDKQIVLGTIDVHTDFVEPPELVRDRILYACKVIGNEEQIVPSNDCGLRTRRWEVAFQKEVNLVRGAEEARRVYEGR